MRILLRLCIPRNGFDVLCDVRNALGRLCDVRKCFLEILRCRRICTDGLKIRHNALNALCRLHEVAGHDVHIGNRAAEVAAVLLCHLLKCRREAVKMRRHLLHIDNKLND